MTAASIPPPFKNQADAPSQKEDGVDARRLSMPGENIKKNRAEGQAYAACFRVKVSTSEIS